MELLGRLIIYCIMFCAVLGCFFSIYDEEHPLGQEFLNGINSIGAIFIPVGGIMASAPYLTQLISNYISPIFAMSGADPSMAATTIIAADMGGYQLASSLAQSKESWMLATVTGFMAGASIVFSIPVALKMLDKKDRPYLALGVMAGFIALPIAFLTSGLFLYATQPVVRELIITSGDASYQLQMTLPLIVKNLLPLTGICIAIACGLYFIPKKMVLIFISFGKTMDILLRIIFVACVVEYFTGFFSTILGSWGFEPLMADNNDINRALEVSGYIGIMLCGAFPMVYIIQTYAKAPLEKIGRLFGLSSYAVAGILAASANVLALFAMVKKLEPADKIKCIAFSVCGAFLIGDHLAFSANFQPTMILPILIGKIVGGCLAVWIVTIFILPILKKEEDNSLY